VIDRPQRFARSSRVDAALGLTAKRRQSGAVECAGHSARWGDGAPRGHLDAAAVALWSRHRGGAALQAWAQGLIKRIGDNKACGARAQARRDQAHDSGVRAPTFSPSRRRWPGTATISGRPPARAA
jgi:hypothetical protein